MTDPQIEADITAHFVDKWFHHEITDEELAHAKEIRQAEHEMRKLRAQRRMATASLAAMGAFTAAMFFVEIERVEALSDISNLFYISGAGIVGAYMGATAWMSKR